ncbi:MAG TPA: hypothetical protein VGA50_17720 [Kiloniellales bacterium]
MDLLPRPFLRLACAACVIVTAGSAYAADRVTVTGGVQGGMGRLEFLWPRAVDYDARVVFGRLVVRFSEPGDFDFAAYQDAMPQYLGTPKVVGDGTVVAFPLRVPVSLHHAQDGPRITIELSGERDLPELRTAAGPEGEPGAAEAVANEAAAEEPAAEPGDAPPRETSAGSTSGETLALRVGEHAGFSRLVFDWPSKVAYRIAQRGRRVTIDFDAAADLDLSNYRRNPLSNVSGIAAERGEGSLSVTLSLPGPRLVRHFLDGSHVVVDVVQDAAAARLAPSVAVVNLEPLPGSSVVRVAAPEAAPATEETVAASGQGAPEAGGEDAMPQSTESGPPEPVPPAATTAPPGAAEPEPARPSLAAVVGAAAEPGEAGETGELTVAEVREAGHGGLRSAPGALVGARKPVLLRFDWPSDPGGAAAFRRGQHLWLVFDRPVAEGAAGLIAETVPDLGPVERLAAENAPSATVLRLKLPWAFVPALRREDRAWIVDLQPRADEPQTAIALEYAAATASPQIQFRIAEAGAALSVRDPDLDDRLEIVPVPAAGLGLKQQRRFLQFRALATYQGLAIVPLSDGLTVETEDGGVIVRDAAGLLVSPGTDRDRALRDKQDFQSGLRQFDPAAWRQADRGG